MKTLMMASIIGGIVSGFFKLGWEILLPPRTPERNQTNPPQYLLQQLGFSKKFTHRYFTFSGQKVQYVSLIMHFSFSIFFSFIYVLAINSAPILGLWQGSGYGVLVWILFHLIIMPITRTIPPVTKQPLEEHISELLGHAGWGLIIQICYVYVLTIN